MRRKGYKKFFVILLSFMFIFSSVAMAYADTFYVGKVGFDMDRMLNDDAYKAKFMEYYAAHTGDGVIVEMAGMTFDVDAYMNAPEGTSMADFAAANPAATPPGAEVWNGVGEPGVPTVDKAALNTKITEAEALVEVEYTADSWAAMQTALTAAKAVAADAEATQAQVDTAATDLGNAVTALVKKPVVDKAALNAKIAEAEALVEAEYTADSWAAMQTALTAAKAVAANAEATQAEVDGAVTDLGNAVTALVKKLAVESVSAINGTTNAATPVTAGAKVPANAKFEIVFSQNVDANTVNAESVRVLKGDVVQASTLAVKDNKVTVTMGVAALPLEENKTYKLNVNGVKNAEGKVAEAYSAEFTVSGEVVIMSNQYNLAGPGYVAFPSTNVINVPFAANDYLAFRSNKALDAATVNTTNVRLYNVTDKAYVTASKVEYNVANKEIQFVLAADLVTNKAYQVQIRNIKALDDNGLAADYNYQFTKASNAVTYTPQGVLVSTTGVYPLLEGGMVQGTFKQGFKAQFTANTELDAASVNDTTVKLYKVVDATETLAPSSVAFTGGMITLTPNADLAEKTTYKLVIDGVKNTMGVILAKDESNTFTTGVYTPLQITNVTPSAGSVLTPATDAKITIEFNRAVNTAAFALSGTAAKVLSNTVTMVLVDNTADTGIDISGLTAIWTEGNKKLDLVVGPVLAPNKSYTVKIAGYAASDRGAAVVGTEANAQAPANMKLAADYEFSFQTQADTVAPTVKQVEAYYNGGITDAFKFNFTESAANVNEGQAVVVRFNDKDLDYANGANIPLTNSSAIRLYDISASGYIPAGQNAVVTKDASKNDYITIPAAALAADKKYRIELTDAIKDTAGNKMKAKNIQFITGAGPAVTAQAPAQGGTLNLTAPNYKDAITITLNGAINQATLTNDNVYVTNLTTNECVSGALTYTTGPDKITFTPVSAWTGNTNYRVTVTTGLKNVLGNSVLSAANAIPGTFNYAFKTQDIEKPTVVSVKANTTALTDGATGVDRASTFYAEFSKKLDGTTVNDNTNAYIQTKANFLLGNATKVATAVSLEADGKTVKIKPSASLDNFTDYVLVFGTGIKDTAANALKAQQAVNFTTSDEATIPLAFSKLFAGSTATEVNKVGSAYQVLQANKSDALLVDYTNAIDITGATVTITNISATPVQQVGVLTTRVNGQGTNTALRLQFTADRTDANTYKIEIAGVKDAVAGTALDAMTIYVTQMNAAPGAPALTVTKKVDASANVYQITTAVANEWSLDGTNWTAGTAGAQDVTIPLAGATVSLRVKATDTAPAGAAATKVYAAQAGAPALTVTKKVADTTGLVYEITTAATNEWSVDGTNWTAGTAGAQDVTLTTAGATVSLRVKATDDALASAAATKVYAAQAAAPAVTLDEATPATAKFVGASTAMEFTIDGGTNWADMTANHVSGVTTVDASGAADIQVRIKATDDVIASAATANLNQ